MGQIVSNLNTWSRVEIINTYGGISGKWKNACKMCFFFFFVFIFFLTFSLKSRNTLPHLRTANIFKSPTTENPIPQNPKVSNFWFWFGGGTMDDYTREMMDLKTLVTRTLEKKGVLAKIRVTIKLIRSQDYYVFVCKWKRKMNLKVSTFFNYTVLGFLGLDPWLGVWM